MSKDNVEQSGRWEFDQEVADAFDDMLERSIPQYEVMRQACFDVACRFVRQGTQVVDLGCSRGEALARLVDRFGAKCSYVAAEISEPMLAAARERFAGYSNCGIVDVRKHDLRSREYLPVKASVTLAVLVLQFVPIEYRQRIIRQIYKTTVPGGALVVVEKVLGGTAEIDELMVDNYYALKEEHGYSGETIERKRLALEGVLVPVTAKWNEELLRSAGFGQVDCFWRWMNFAAWVAVKDE